MAVGGTIVSVLIGLLAVAAVVVFAYGGYLLMQERSMAVGAIVQMTFTGNPAFLTTALMGPKGEYAGALKYQDALNALYCDVPGSAGAYSSWYRPAGQAASSDAYAQASYSTRMTSEWSCTSDADCAVLPWMECGATSSCMRKFTTWDADDATLFCCNGSTSTNPTGAGAVCSVSGGDTRSAVCVLTSASEPLPGVPLYTCNTATRRCVGGAATPGTVVPCNTWGKSQCSAVPSGACNTLRGACVSDVPEHVLINTPWLAEGVVASINPDSSVNVAWKRVQCLYKWPGPTLSWFPPDAAWNYQQCRFISDDASKSAVDSNAMATGIALGPSVGSVTYGDVVGLPTWTNLDPKYANAWNAVDATLGYGWMGPMADGKTGGLPILAEAADAASSAWNLSAYSLSAASLKRVSTYSIQPLGSTSWNTALLASMTAYRSQYMASRPPHLQIH